ncbi:unnamed protein product [Effrenium voratum]|nr:unnamed protein product [Effrenium voratum]
MTRCIARTLLAVLAVASEAANGLEKVVFSGRWFQAPGGMQFSWGTGTFLARFLGTGLSAELEPYALPMYHTCQVDQAEPQRIEHLSGLLSIASGLSAGEHLVRCGRSTEAFYGPTVLLGFRVEGTGGTLLEAPALSDKALRVAFLGDSITAGWQVLLPAGSTEQGGPANEDAFRTWAADLARSWTEDWRTVAQTSIGVLPHTSPGCVL